MDQTEYTLNNDKQSRLRRIKAAHNLTQQQIATLVGVSIHTVNQWFKPTTTKNHRSPGPCCLELLELKLKLRRQS